MPGKRNGDPIVLQSVSKAGYELKDKGLIGRQQAFSTQVPIEIVMVNIRQLEAEAGNTPSPEPQNTRPAAAPAAVSDASPSDQQPPQPQKGGEA